MNYEIEYEKLTFYNLRVSEDYRLISGEKNN